MQLKTEAWGEYEGHPAKLITVSDPNTGFMVQVTDFGATLVKVMVPDKNGKLDDVNYGQNAAKDFVEQGGFFGAVVGRTANRIGDAKFTLEGKEYNLYVNNSNRHSLHGGKVGFNFKFWECIEAKATEEEAIVKYKYVSVDGEENYPGNLTVITSYIIKPNYLEWSFEANTDKTTIINMTNHSYWNLDGLYTTIDEQTLRLDSDKYMPGDETLIPTGEVVEVEGTGYDFRKEKSFADIFKDQGDIDNNFFVNGYKKGNEEPVFIAKVKSPKTGRTMDVYTTEPCIQVYSANFMGGIKSFGKECDKHGAICLETQRVPNAVNFPEFRGMMILKPEEKYIHKTIHKFSA